MLSSSNIPTQESDTTSNSNDASTNNLLQDGAVEEQNYVTTPIKSSFCRIKPHETQVTVREGKEDQYCEDQHSLVQTFMISPLEVGHGITIGNALRRVMLTHLKGIASYAIKIQGIKHEFDAIEGVEEDMTNIILNVKGIILKLKAKSDILNAKLSCKIKGPTVVTAGMLNTSDDVSIVNEEHVICHINSDRELSIEIFVNSGFGYTVAEDHVKETDDVIFIDSLYSPVRKISYKIESAYGVKDFQCEKLLVNIETNGAIEPQFALAMAARMLKEKLSIFDPLGHKAGLLDMDIISDDESIENKIPEVLYTKISDTYQLGNRAITCLRNNRIIYLGDLIQHKENDILKLKNLGQTTFKKVKDWVVNITDPYNSELKLRFDMEVPGWKQ